MSQLEAEPNGPEFAEIPGEYRFIIVRPGGNDSALVAGIVDDRDLRKKINDVIMAKYPNVEQVGFVSLIPGAEEFSMSGFEMCGNVARATGALALGFKPGMLEIGASGVKRKLKAGVKPNGDAFSEMPIFSDASKVMADALIPGNFLVEMEGIVQYIDFRPLDPNLTEEEIKQQSFAFMEERGLTAYPAAGIMYCTPTERGWDVVPVVYVPDAGENGTLFLETACGSGTTALGMVLAKKEKASLTEVPIFQPSGLPIRVTVTMDGENYSYAEISGPVEILIPMDKICIDQSQINLSTCVVE